MSGGKGGAAGGNGMPANPAQNMDLSGMFGGNGAMQNNGMNVQSLRAIPVAIVSLDSFRENVRNTENISHENNFEHNGLEVKGNYYNLSNNMNGGLQRIGIW